jgi:hypothetical protein
MSLLSTLIHQGVRLGAYAERPRQSALMQQQRVLLQLLHKARNTAFGRYYGFQDICTAQRPRSAFLRQVPATDYNALYERWWSKAHLEDLPDISWPGKVPYFALSSGTSQAATKHIPVTLDMLRSMKQGSRMLFYDMRHFGLPKAQFTKQMLMVGSCTKPRPEGQHFSGDLSGIIGLNRPLWLERYYRPGRHISDLPEWDQRIERIAEEAPGWDIGGAVANPMWMQLVLEKIIERHGLRHIHELWPNFALFIHGGVFFEPYRATFEQLLGNPVRFVDSYMASEGFFAYQNRPDVRAMQLLTDGGVYFEFVPFDARNFDDNGDLHNGHPESLSLAEVQENQPYALLISTCAGAWRYLLGDTLMFTDAERCEVRLTGRTKQSLSVCGEHLSIDNLNAAVAQVDQAMRLGVREFCVAGLRQGSKWAHRWYMSVDNPGAADPAQIAAGLDTALCQLNEDYAVERRYALQNVELRILPNAYFMEWLCERGKMNGQAKIPRVLKGAQYADFERFLSKKQALGKK